MSLTFYGYKNCDTCRRAEKELKNQSIAYNYIDITTKPPGKVKLKKIIEQSGEDIKKFLNTSGQAYRQMKLKDKLATMKEAEIISLLSQNGRLLKRPIVTDGKKSSVGFKDSFKKHWL